MNSSLVFLVNASWLGGRSSATTRSPLLSISDRRRAQMGADTSGGRRPAVRPQAEQVLAGQVIQNPLDHRRVFDARADLDSAAIIRASLDAHLEYPLDALSPSDRCLLLGRRAIFLSCRLGSRGAPTPPSRHDPCPIGTVVQLLRPTYSERKVGLILRAPPRDEKTMTTSGQHSAGLSNDSHKAAFMIAYSNPEATLFSYQQREQL